MHDWMSAVKTPVPYRVGSSVQIRPSVVMKMAILVIGVLTVMVILFPLTNHNGKCGRRSGQGNYNALYPLTVPAGTSQGTRFRIGAITDLDTDSKSSSDKNTWVAHMLKGYLTISPDHDRVNIIWDDDMMTLKSKLSLGGRGMELSELVVFNGKLYSVDDRTGVIYEIKGDQVIPWVILSDGDGSSSKGFKGEWATVKDEEMYVGGLGKEWTSTTGKVESINPQWVKSIGINGDVVHHNWQKNYNSMRHKAGSDYPGYLIHESGVWSDIHKKWFFLPRRASKFHYDETADEKRATNMMLICDEKFENIQLTRIGPLNPTHGFSSFKFIPGTRDQVIVALKSEEDQGKVNSYVLAFTIDGEILLDETKMVGNFKFEGIEFL